MLNMRRRQFMSLLGSVAAWPSLAYGQAISKPRLAFLGAASAQGYSRQLEGFRLGLRDFGYDDNNNIVIEYRWAEGRYDRLPELALDLVRWQPDVIVTHGTPATFASKKASSTIPIVMAIIGDPVATGVVASEVRPAGNVTGSSWFSPEVQSKRVELLKELMPQLARVAALLNPENPITRTDVEAMESMARAIDVRFHQFAVSTPSDFGNAFKRMRQEQVEALVVQDEGMLIANSAAIASFAQQHRIILIGGTELAKAGGVIGYGVDFVAAFRRAGAFVDKILKGTKPADIPIERATKFEVVLNLKGATALGIDVPTSILLRATEVIE